MHKRTDPSVRFWAKVDKHGPVPVERPDLGECWVWTGARLRSGYGSFNSGGGHKGTSARLGEPNGAVVLALARNSDDASGSSLCK